jgi:hypothetical protein
MRARADEFVEHVETQHHQIGGALVEVGDVECVARIGARQTQTVSCERACERARRDMPSSIPENRSTPSAMVRKLPSDLLIFLPSTSRNAQHCAATKA